MLNLSAEINMLVSKECSVFQHAISARKIKQLGLLTRASALLYLATGSYVLSGILGVVFESESKVSVPSITLYVETIFVFTSIFLLIIYAFRAVKIRQDQFVNSQENHVGKVE